MNEAAAGVTPYVTVSGSSYSVVLYTVTEKPHCSAGTLNELSFWSRFSKGPEKKSDISSGLDIL